MTTKRAGNTWKQTRVRPLVYVYTDYVRDTQLKTMRVGEKCTCMLRLCVTKHETYATLSSGPDNTQFLLQTSDYTQLPLALSFGLVCTHTCRHFMLFKTSRIIRIKHISKQRLPVSTRRQHHYSPCHATRVWFEQTDSIRRFYYPWVQAGGAYHNYTSRVYF